jgi:biotin transporter BioY
VVEGACGLPFFSGGGGGPQVLLGPTGGYIVAFPAAAFITGAFAEHGWDKRFLTAAAAMAIGSALILLAGWAWLTQFMSATVALHAGVTKFIIGDIVKIVLAAAVLPSGWYLLKRRASHR